MTFSQNVKQTFMFGSGSSLAQPTGLHTPVQMDKWMLVWEGKPVNVCSAIAAKHNRRGSLYEVEVFHARLL